MEHSIYVNGKKVIRTNIVFALYVNSDANGFFEYGRQIIGIFTSKKELALAMKQHKKELGLKLKYKSVKKYIKAGEALKLNGAMEYGSIAMYELNVDYDIPPLKDGDNHIPTFPSIIDKYY